MMLFDIVNDMFFMQVEYEVHHIIYQDSWHSFTHISFHELLKLLIIGCFLFYVMKIKLKLIIPKLIWGGDKILLFGVIWNAWKHSIKHDWIWWMSWLHFINICIGVDVLASNVEEQHFLVDLIDAYYNPIKIFSLIIEKSKY